MNTDLMREAGFAGGFVNYKNITVDNGADISGTGATGNFVEVSYDENNNRSIKDYGDSLKGVILLSRAFLTFRDKTKTKKKVLQTEEFNPTLTKKRDKENALIPIYQLDFNGQRQKNDDGKFIVEYAFYEDLKTGKKNNLKGMDFDYTIVIYVLTGLDVGAEKEIVKIKFKGAGRGNFFDYQKKIFKDFRRGLPEVITEFSTYLEKEYNKYAIAFKPCIKEDGQPEQYNNQSEIENEIQVLIEASMDKRKNLLPPSENNILTLKGNNLTAIAEPKSPIEKAEDEIDSSTAPESQDLPPVEAYENEASDEIKIEDIPVV